MSAVERSRGILATIWSASFAASLAVPFVVYALGRIESSSLKSSIGDISGIYAPHVGAILAYYFATKNRGKPKALRQTPLILALTISTLWNGAVLVLVMPPLWGGGALTDATSAAKEIAPHLGWIVAPVLGHFFAKAAA